MNAEEVARLLGINDKTVRRHLKKGTITATRKASGELKISDDQVEKLRLVLELEDEGRHVQHVVNSGELEQVDVGKQVETLVHRLTQLEHQQPEITVLIHELGKLQAQVGVLTARVEELESRYVAHENVATPSTSTSPMEETPRPSPPQKRIVAPSSGMLSASEFAKQLGVSYDAMKNFIRRGVEGERLDVTEVKHATREGYVQKFFSQEQQEMAIFLLRRHGKLKER